jgi:hypothetical protein
MTKWLGEKLYRLAIWSNTLDLDFLGEFQFELRCRIWILAEKITAWGDEK